jgi:chromosome segregation ATPase
MIEQLLLFASGMLVAALIWLLFLPAFWRRATRLSREAIEQSLPLTSNEIAAEQDRLRAAHAIEIGAIRHVMEEANDRVAAAKAETGERLKAEASFIQRIEQGQRRIAELEVERDHLTDLSARLTTDLAAMTEARNAANETIGAMETQRDGLIARLNTAVDLAETRRIRIEDLETVTANLTQGRDEEAMRATNLRLELQTVEIQLRETQRELAELRVPTAIAQPRDGESLEIAPLPKAQHLNS